MKYTTLYTLILGLFSIGWTDCPEDFMERMQRPGHSEIQLSKVTISGRVLDESGFPLAGATIQEKETLRCPCDCPFFVVISITPLAA